MDYKIFELINGLSGKNNLVDSLGVFFGVYLIYLLVLFVIIIAFKRRYFSNAIFALSTAVISRFAIVEAVKRIVNRPRPYEVINTHLLVVDTEKGLSFSSGHTVIMFAIAFSFYKTKYFYPLIILASVGSIARVYIGVHYPTDIFVSIIIAGLVVWGLRRLFKSRFLS